MFLLNLTKYDFYHKMIMFGNPRTGGHVRCILLELYFKQFSLPKGDCRRCMANNLMFSTCTHAGLNWFRLLTEGQDKPLHWCGNVASWTVNMSIYCETQSHSVHWLSSPIFPCSSPWSLLLVMLLVKLTISVNKMHFRGVRGVTFCDILAQTCP